MSRNRILYGVDILNAGDLGARIPHSQQSRAADILLDRLGEAGRAGGAQSRSHSRAAVAATLAEAPQINLGIDIEWMAEDRPFAAMAELFMAVVPPRIDAAQFYRGWTFYEAYYKAFQARPHNLAIARVMAEADDHGTLLLGDGIYLMQCNILGAFQLCLVWSVATAAGTVPNGAEAMATPHYIPAS